MRVPTRSLPLLAAACVLALACGGGGKRFTWSEDTAGEDAGEDADAGDLDATATDPSGDGVDPDAADARDARDAKDAKDTRDPGPRDEGGGEDPGDGDDTDDGEGTGDGGDAPDGEDAEDPGPGDESPVDADVLVIPCLVKEDCFGLVLPGPCQTLDCQDGRCVTPDVPDFTRCDDRDACTLDDRCRAGQCVGAARDCEDGSPCTLDGCLPATGCTREFVPGDCDDGNACTTGDTCQQGLCLGTLLDCDDGNVCTNDSCDPASGCTHGPVTGRFCDDGLACTAGDRCLAGTCTGTSSCDDGNDCTDDACTAGGCTREPVSRPCNDGDPCTTGDACVLGACQGVPNPCDDGNPCTVDACLPGVGCTWTLATGACDDGDPCTTGDACQDGRCRGDALACLDPPDAVCLPDGYTVVRSDAVGTCEDGTCTYRRRNYACTNGCLDGACVGNPCEGVDCSTPPGTCWKAGSCVQGACQYPPNDGAACDDQDACTTGDHCLSGSCVGGPALACSDGNACTAGRCDRARGCVYAPVDGPCEDGNPCTTGDACLEGSCRPGSATDCDDGNPCTDDRCGTATGCVHAPRIDGLPCDDRNGCTGEDKCRSGACVGTGLTCDDGNPCTDDRCDDPAVGCYALPNTAACSDGDACTAGDRCAGSACVPGPAASCDDRDPCTRDTCDPATGCAHAPDTGPACDDGDPCTTGDSCRAGACAGTPVCQDGNPCTDDFCDPDGRCQYEPRSGACDDGNDCTEGDACAAGACLGTPRACDDGNPCTDDGCQRGVGCVSTASPVRPCDDGNGCTQGDACEDGRCQGRPVTCDTPPPNTCNEDEGFIVSYSRQGTCTGGACVYPSQQYGCTHGCQGTACLGDPCEGIDCTLAPNPCYLAPGTCVLGSCDYLPANGAGCDDGDPCTLSDTCQNGACVGGDSLGCDDGNPCTTDRCAPGLGCVHDPRQGSCDDGDACTVGDACTAGACVPGPRDTCDDGNPCTTDRCDALAGCSHGAVAEGFPCSDGNGCTSNDRCQAGRCAGDGLGCDDGNPCTDDRCDDPQVGCYHLPNALACTDGNPCTAGDACVDGGCLPGLPDDCDDGNYCTDDSCAPGTGCAHANHTRSCADAFCSGLTYYRARQCNGGRCPAAVRVDCDDRVACTVDTCSAAGCANLPDDSLCPDDGDPCTSARCHPLLGCQYVAEALPCDDGDACTFLDTCGAALGCAGTPYACNDLLDCTADACDGFGGCLSVVLPGACRVGGACLAAGDPDPENPCRQCDPARDPYGWSPRDGVPCNDGSTCTTGDTCGGGTCAGTPLACDDGNPCTDDRCDDEQGCLHPPNAAGCDDGDPCTVGDLCSAGACTAGLPATCDDGNPCTSADCDPATGCTFAPLAASCDDGDACTLGDQCLAGTCRAGSPRDCDDGNPCTADGCDPDRGCTRTAAPEGTPCDDGVTCTTGDACTAGRCAGTGPDCDDDNPCTDDRCDTVQAGCYHVANTLPCDDGTACTAVDACSGGTCTGTQPLDCDDGNPCTTDTCDPALGCRHADNADPCDDGNACTTADTCWMGRCLGGAAPSCDDGNPCTTDRCDPLLGCTTTPITLPCNDGNPCTSGDLCQAGTCAGTPYDCNDGRPCTTDTCNGLGGCSHAQAPGTCLIQGTCYADGQANPNDPCRICDPDNTATAWTDNAGGACDDGRPCTRGDVCTGGVCSGTTYSCNDQVPCTTDTCDGAGGCLNTVATGWCAIEGQCFTVGTPNPSNGCLKCAAGVPKAWSDNDGASCSDGNPCTLSDACLDGACAGGPPKTCSDGNLCTDDSCNPSSGGCVYTYNDAQCEPAGCQGLLFQAERRCSGGMCPARNPVNCDDGNPCTRDTCDAAGCHHEPSWDACDDNNPCTYGDTCSSGTCSGTPYVCETSECVSRSTCDGAGGCIPTPRPDGSACSADANACTNDICQAGACQHPPKVDGTACNDGNACTATDVCQAGTCTGTAPVTCPAPDSCHLDGTCNPATGACTPPAKPEGAPCDDGNRCTQLDTCSGGRCTGGDPKVCQPLDQCHLAGACYPLTGECTNPSKADGALCNDGNPCTRSDTCQAGTCTGADPLPCFARDACHLAGTCDPATGQCTDPEAPDGTGCDDGNRCTRDDACAAGRCGGTDVVCLPKDACHDPGTCNPSTGACSQPPKAEGASCDDGVACTKQDTCSAGRCSGLPYACGDALLCTADRCLGDGGCDNPLLAGWCLIGGACQPENLPDPGNPCRSCQPALSTTGWSDRDGTPCADGQACTRNDACLAGTCVGETYACDDGVPCTDDVCDGNGGCLHPRRPGWCRIGGTCHADGTQNPANPCQRCRAAVNPDGWTAAGEGDGCDDGNPCTYGEACISGTCSGVSYSCDDFRSCTADTCLGDGRCSHDAVAGACFIRNTCFDDGDPDPLDSCRACDPATDPLDFTPVGDGQACDDGNPCSSGDACQAGICRGVGSTCDDGLLCTADACDGQGGCNHVLQTGWCLIDGVCRSDHQVDPMNACAICEIGVSTSQWSPRTGTWCDDGDGCTLGDVCVGTTCTGGAARDCADSFACTTDACVAGECTRVLQAGWCLADGACRADGSVDPLNPCNRCDAAADPQRWTYDDGKACDDGLACTRQDRCTAGACSGVAYACDDGRACTADACNGDAGCSYTLQAGWCLVGGQCRADGDPDPANPCRGCVASASTTAWTNLDGLACDDGVACTSGDACQGGTCAGVAAQCGDDRVCTDDTCDAAGICRHAVRAGWCLIGGQCVAAGTEAPGDPCRTCQPAVGLTDYSPVTGAACDDGQDCTMADTCLGGTCLGTAYSCDDGLACTLDACTGAGSCQHVQLADTCWIGGACYPSGTTDPANPCRHCNPAQSATGWTSLAGGACNDGNPCTKDDTCATGTCVGTAFSCSDGLACTLDLCDGSGGCSNPLADGWCHIEGTCYTNGTPAPGAPCKACNASVDRYGWTVLSAGAVEICNGVDDNCDGVTDPPGLPDCTTYWRDDDGDGYGVAGDSRCLCTTQAPYRATAPGDCDDGNFFARPGGIETCDGADNDCNGTADPEGTRGCIPRYFDFDGDNRGVDGASRCLCAGDGLWRAVLDGDCDDANAAVSSDFPEICDGQDNDCDGLTDPPGTSGCIPWYRDADGDGWGGSESACRCGSGGGYVTSRGGDCDDSRPSVNPQGVEACNLLDDDCDGTTDDGSTQDLCPLDAGVDPHGTLGSCSVGRCVYTCVAGTASDPGWHDTDRSGRNGCECQGDVYDIQGGSGCQDAVNLGVLEDTGVVVTVDGKLVSDTDSDWYVFTATDADPLGLADGCDTFDLLVSLVQNPGDAYLLDVVRGQCPSMDGCNNVTLYNWGVSFHTDESGECPCSSSVASSCLPPSVMADCLAAHGTSARCGSCPGEAAAGTHRCADNSQVFWVRVHWAPGAPARCGTYRLEIANGRP